MIHKPITDEEAISRGWYLGCYLGMASQVTRETRGQGNEVETKRDERRGDHPGGQLAQAISNRIGRIQAQLPNSVPHLTRRSSH